MQKDTSNSRKVELERQVQRLKNLLVSYEDAVAKHPQLRQQQNFLQREDLLKTRLSVLINELEELSRKPQKTNNTSRSITWRPWGDFPPVVALSVIVSFIALVTWITGKDNLSELVLPVVSTTQIVETLPITPSESAIAPSSNQPLANTSTQTIPSAFSTIIPTLVPLPTATIMPNRLVSFDAGIFCPEYVLPSEVNFDNIEEAQSSLLDIFMLNKNFSSSQIAWTNFYVFATIENISNEQSWIEISNELRVTILSKEDIPDIVHINFIQCGAPGMIRVFPDVLLTGKDIEYTETITYPDADFFTLQPGEFERFAFGLNCSSPGKYMVQLDIQYRHSESTSIAATPITLELVCPKRLIAWSINPDDYNNPHSISAEIITTQEWNGTNYSSNR